MNEQTQLEELEAISKPAKFTETLTNALSNPAHGNSTASKDLCWRQRNNSKPLVVTRVGVKEEY